jgi:protein TonB
MRHGVIAIALVLAACSRGEPEKVAVRSSTSAAVTPAAPTAPAERASYAPGEALKERLARQEAAARMLDAPAAPAKLPEPPRTASPAKQPATAAKEPVPAAKAPEAAKPAPAVAAKSEPAKPAEPVKVAAAAPPPPAPAQPVAPRAEPAKSEPAPRVEVAAAKPAAAPPPGTRLLQRVEPDFPREALQAGEDKGIVQARVTIDERGGVTRVEVLEAQPRRLFDRAVIRALSQWKYNEGAAGRTADVEVAFRK